MTYTCEICTDYIDPSKTEEILKKIAKIVTEAIKRNEEHKKEVNA